MTKIKKVFNKHHQLYLLISFFIFIFLITFYSLIFPKKESIVSSIVPTPTLRPTNTSIPTITKISPQPFKSVDGTYTVGTRTLEVKTDIKTKEALLYFKENGQNILIDSIISPYYYGQVSLVEFSISTDNNYLIYQLHDGDFSSYKLYSFPDKRNIELKINLEYSGFSKNNEYFYICSIGGFSYGGAYIYRLPKMELVYQDKNDRAKCQYDSSNNSLKISYTDYDKPFFTNTVYYFDTNKSVSQ